MKNYFNIEPASTRRHQRGGFTLFFAILVGALALAVGLAIYDITVRELLLSNVATQSQFAIYAADTGIECALYWDAKCNLTGCASGSVFATSTSNVMNGVAFPPASGVFCNGQDIAASALAAGKWPATPTATAATSTYSIYVSAQSQISATTTCAIVTVAKSGNPTQTVIVSHGYNTCVAGPIQVERVLQVTY